MINSLIDAFVDRWRVTIFVMVAIIIAGFETYVSIPKESTPDVKIPIIYTVVVLEGISPEDGERLLIKPLEKQLKTIEGIKEITSYAYEGSASVLLEFNAGFDSAKALNDVRAKVQDAEKDLPTDAKKPSVNEINLSRFPVLNVVLRGDIPERALIKIARELKTQIEGIPEVLSVAIGGDREEALEIIVEPKVLETYNLTLDTLRQVISQNNRLIAAGSLRTQSGEYSVKIPSLIADYATLMNFPVKVDGDNVTRLKDVAEVRKTYKDPANIARVNGKPAVVLEVSKRTGENIIDTVKSIKSVISDNKKYLPENLEIIYSNDNSEEIIDMVSDLENTIIIAIFLVMGVVIASVGFRSAILISLSIPFSFLAGILFLGLTDHTLNVVVLFSLILTIGMIVDDAIVVSEFADRIMHEGVPPDKAFLFAAKRMLWPIVTSTLVKIVVFLPLLFWPGVIGQFMKYMPITVIVILSNSLIFALFFQPTLGPMFGKPSHVKSKENFDSEAVDHVDLKSLEGFTKKYYHLLLKVLDNPKKFVFSIVGILVVTYTFFGVFGTGVEFFPKIEPNSANIYIKSPGNLSLYERDALMKEVEEKAQKYSDEIKVLYAKAGSFIGGNDISDDTVIILSIEFKKWNTRRKAKYIIDDLKKEFKSIGGIVYDVLENKDGPPAEKPIQFNILGYEYDEALRAAEYIGNKLKNVEGLIDVEDSRSKPAIEWQIIPERDKAARYGVDLFTLGGTIQLISNGLIVSNYRPDDNDEEVDILIRFPEEYRSISALDRINVVNFKGEPVPISNFVTKVPSQKVGQIKKSNRQKVVSFKANVANGYLADTKVKELRQMFENERDKFDVMVEFKGEDKDQKEAGDFLKNAFILTLVMMFVIMLMQFNNYYHTLIIMSAVFLSTVGVLLGLIITWQPFGVVMCGIGIIALGGIVLNNNILFIDTYQHLRKNGMEIDEAIIRSGVQRMRPIILTATTAVLGLLPMVFGLTINLFDREITYDAPSSQWWRQLSASIAGGLTFATILTLFFTPCLLKLGKRFDK